MSDPLEIETLYFHCTLEQLDLIVASTIGVGPNDVLLDAYTVNNPLTVPIFLLELSEAPEGKVYMRNEAVGAFNSFLWCNPKDTKRIVSAIINGNVPIVVIPEELEFVVSKTFPGKAVVTIRETQDLGEE